MQREKAKKTKAIQRRASMACNLSKSTDPSADYVGKIGATVQLKVTGTQGSAVIVAGRYAGQDLAAPWQFQVKAGVNFLILLVENSVPRDWTTIQEDCGSGAQQTLREYRYDPYGASQSFEILGN
jgi:hypothetical protein